MPLGTTGMRLFDSTKTSSLTRSVIVARNENSPYLFYCLDTRSLRRRQLTANDVVLRLTAKMPPFARGLYNGSNPRIAEKSKYDVRYATCKSECCPNRQTWSIILSYMTPLSCASVTYSLDDGTDDPLSNL